MNSDPGFPGWLGNHPSVYTYIFVLGKPQGCVVIRISLIEDFSSLKRIYYQEFFISKFKNKQIGGHSPFINPNFIPFCTHN